LNIAAEGMTGDITYGLWNDRNSDVIHRNVSFPFVLDPSADGLSSSDGEYYVIKIAFQGMPSRDIPVEVQAIQ